MAITYACSKCGARMTLDGPVETLNCPVCKIAMTEERGPGGISTGTGPTPSSVHTPYRTATPARTFQGLKVARPIRKFGEMSDTGSKPLPPPLSVAPLVQPQPVAVPPDTGSNLAVTREIQEQLIVTAREQAKKEADLILRDARLTAEDQTRKSIQAAEDEVRRILQNARQVAQDEAESMRKEAEANLLREAERFGKEIRDKAEQEASQILQRAKDDSERMRKETETGLLAEAGKMAATAKTEAEKIVAEANAKAEKEAGRIAKEAREKAEQETERVRRLAEENFARDAEVVAKELKAKAEKEAEEIRAKAREEALELRRKPAAELEAQKAKLAEEAEALKKASQAEIEALKKKLQEQDEKLKTAEKTAASGDIKDTVTLSAKEARERAREIEAQRKGHIQAKKIEIREAAKREARRLLAADLGSWMLLAYFLYILIKIKPGVFGSIWTSLLLAVDVYVLAVTLRAIVGYYKKPPTPANGAEKGGAAKPKPGSTDPKKGGKPDTIATEAQKTGKDAVAPKSDKAAAIMAQMGKKKKKGGPAQPKDEAKPTGDSATAATPDKDKAHVENKPDVAVEPQDAKPSADADATVSKPDQPADTKPQAEPAKPDVPAAPASSNDAGKPQDAKPSAAADATVSKPDQPADTKPQAEPGKTEVTPSVPSPEATKPGEKPADGKHDNGTPPPPSDGKEKQNTATA